MLMNLATMVGGALLVSAFLRPPQCLSDFIGKLRQELVNIFESPVEITFYEFTGQQRKIRSEAYIDIQTYLASIAGAAGPASRFRASSDKNSTPPSLILAIDDYENVTDVFEGVNIWWFSGIRSLSKKKKNSFTDTRYYRAYFNKRDWDLVSGPYLNQVLKEGKALQDRTRQKKLCTNSGDGDGAWLSAPFRHPATFETLALDPVKKTEIVEDLKAFSDNEEYCKGVGRAWKRVYLLDCTPEISKSAAIASFANLLNYDVYDLELTGVENKSELKKLLMETSSKSMVVIDIDCLLDLTDHDHKNKGKIAFAGEEEEEGKGKGTKPIKMTLSELLNFVDGLWFTCGGERLMAFMTNHVEKLDQAFIRKGRINKKVELSFCSFEAFKVLAKNYRNLDSHPLLPKIRELLEEVDVTLADVAEHLTGICLEELVSALEKKKNDSKANA